MRDETDKQEPSEEEAALRDGELRSLTADSVSFKGHCVMTDLTLNLVGQSAGPKAIKIRAAFSVFKDGSVGLIGTN